MSADAGLAGLAGHTPARQASRRAVQSPIAALVAARATVPGAPGDGSARRAANVAAASTASVNAAASSHGRAAPPECSA